MKKILYILFLLFIPVQVHAQYLKEIRLLTPFETTSPETKDNIYMLTCRSSSIVFIDSQQLILSKSEIMDIQAVIEVTPGLTPTFDSKETQGPITGFEGHNFVAEPAIIYPNPVKDILQVKSTDPITVIEILNAQGQLETQLDPKMQMMVTDLPAGIHYARIFFENKKEVQVEKIMIIK